MEKKYTKEEITILYTNQQEMINKWKNIELEYWNPIKGLIRMENKDEKK